MGYIQNDNMSLHAYDRKLTEPEKQQLSALKFPKYRENGNQEVDSVEIGGFKHEEFFKEFLAARKIDREVLDCRLFRFGSVGMHVDSLGFRSKYDSVIIMIYGSGEIQFMSDCIESEELTKFAVFVFDDSKPHSFINKGKSKCVAIISSLKI